MKDSTIIKKMREVLDDFDDDVWQKAVPIQICKKTRGVSFEKKIIAISYKTSGCGKWNERHCILCENLLQDFQQCVSHEKWSAIKFSLSSREKEVESPQLYFFDNSFNFIGENRDILLDHEY